MTDIETKVYICGGYRIILIGRFNLWTENWLVKSAEIILFVKWTTKLVGVWMCIRNLLMQNWKIVSVGNVYQKGLIYLWKK